MTQQTGTTVDRGAESSGGSPTEPAPTESASTTGASESETTADDSTASGADRPPESSALPLDQTFEILKNQRRRYVLHYLNSADGPVSLSDLAEQIAAWENDKEIREITSSERKRVYVGLYQCHLPKMAGMDVISFNKPRGIIEPGEHIDTFDQYLEPNESPGELTLNTTQLGVCIVCIGLFPLVVLALTQTILPIFATVGGVVLLTIGAVVHLKRRETASTAQSDETVA